MLEGRGGHLESDFVTILQFLDLWLACRVVRWINQMRHGFRIYINKNTIFYPEHPKIQPILMNEGPGRLVRTCKAFLRAQQYQNIHPKIAL
jgi:hypothetical protein